MPQALAMIPRVFVPFDNHHLLGVWEISSGDLIVQGNAANGIPPQIRALSWSSNQSFVTAGVLNLCHYFTHPR